jgi:hypothetical protein
MVTNSMHKGHSALDRSRLKTKSSSKGARPGSRSLPLKKMSEYLAGGNTCLLSLDASTRYKAESSDFDLKGWLAEHQPGVDALADFIKANFPCRAVKQEIWLPEIALTPTIHLSGKADVVGYLEDGGIVVGDFKTGTWESDAHWIQCALAARSLVKDGQGQYIAAVVRQYQGKVPEVEDTIGNILGASQIDLVKKVLATLDAGEAEPTSTLSNCKFCDFRKYCSEAVLEPKIVESSVEDFFSF